MNTLTELQEQRLKALAIRDGVLERRGGKSAADMGGDGWAPKLEALAAHIADLDEQISERKRAGDDNPEIVAMKRATATGDDWAVRAADAIRKANGGNESRAISSGSVEVPVLIEPTVTPKSRPTRLVDLLVNREVLTESNAFEYFRQTTRTTNAAAVPDLGTKPTSVYSIESINDRCRVLAHLSEAVPIRLWKDAVAVVEWLENELLAGLLDTLEAQVINGTGVGENLTGVLKVAGTTAVPFATDVPTTLRKALTAFQQTGVTPTALVLNPADAEGLDLLKEGTGGVGYLLDGYTNGTASSANVLGTVQRLISPSVPAGTAVLGDWSKVKLFIREDSTIDIDAGGDLFKINAAILRAEMRVGLAHLRPADFAVIDLTA